MALEMPTATYIAWSARPHAKKSAHAATPTDAPRFTGLAVAVSTLSAPADGA
jgi:hypothetical protein